jgi:hypothetical protein
MNTYKLLFGLFITSIVYSCNNKNANSTKSTDNVQEFIDSMNIARRADSAVKQTIKNIYIDTAGSYQSPVKIIKAWFTKREYSSYKDVAVTYKNTSGKKIEALRINWYGENAFNEPADMMSAVDGVSGGYSDEPLKAGQTRTSEWNVMSRDGKKILRAWVTEVVFSDGTKWELRN